MTETRLVGWLSYQSPALQTGARAIFCLLLLLPATVALGATLPLIAEFCAESGNVGRRFTMAYAVNTLVFHNSVYTFAAVLTVFLLALAAGIGAFSILIRWTSPIAITVVSSLGGPAGIGISVLLFVHLTRLRYFSAGETFWEFLSAATALVLIVVFPPVFFLGMILPAAWYASGGIQSAAGKTVGRLTAANTIAAAGGSITATFLLPPLLGLWGSFAALAVVAVLIAVAVAWATAGRWPTVIAAAVPLAIACTRLVGMNSNSAIPGRAKCVLILWQNRSYDS